MNKNFNLYILEKKINHRNFIVKKYINGNENNLYLSESKYIPASSKEWKNSIYLFNNNNIKNLPSSDLNINELLNYYFNLHLNINIIKNSIFSVNKIYRKINNKNKNKKSKWLRMLYNRRLKLLVKIYFLFFKRKKYLSKKKNKYIKYLKIFYLLIKNYINNKRYMENTNYILSIKFFKLNTIKYIKKLKYLKNLKYLEKMKYLKEISYLKTLKKFNGKKSFKKIKIFKKFNAIDNLLRVYISKAEIKHTNFKTTITVYVYDRKQKLLKSFMKRKFWVLKRYLIRMYYISYILRKIKSSSDLLIFNLFEKKYIKYLWRKLGKGLIWKYKLKYNLYNYKFQENFLYKLNMLISRYYNKKVEYNIIKIGNLVYNTDVFANILGLKYRSRKFNIIKVMANIFGRVIHPLDDKLKKAKSRRFNTKYIIQNWLNNILTTENSLDIKIKDIFKEKQEKIFKEDDGKKIDEIKLASTISSMKFKTIKGIQIGAKGRLTRRYRADRTVNKILIEGGLKNFISSFQKLSSPMYRGNKEVNVEYSVFVSKRRIGSYAVKGWLSYL